MTATTTTHRGRVELHWTNAAITAVVGLLTIGLAYYLGYQGIGLSWVGGVIVGVALLTALLEFIAYRLAEIDPNTNTNHPLAAIIIANCIMGGLVGLVVLLGPKIGWWGAIATIGLVALWATTVVAALVHRRS